MYLLPGVTRWADPGVLVIADEILLVESLDLEGVQKLLPGVLQWRDGVEKGNGEFIFERVVLSRWLIGGICKFGLNFKCEQCSRQK